MKVPNLIVILSQNEGVYKHRNVEDIDNLKGINMMKEPRNEDLKNLYLYQNSHQYVTIKQKAMNWMGFVADVGDMTRSYRIWVGKCNRSGHLRKLYVTD